MRWTIITPSGVEVPEEVEADPSDAYLQGLKERGYEVKPKVTVHRKPFEECEACSA